MSLLLSLFLFVKGEIFKISMLQKFVGKFMTLSISRNLLYFYL